MDHRLILRKADSEIPLHELGQHHLLRVHHPISKYLFHHVKLDNDSTCIGADDGITEDDDVYDFASVLVVGEVEVEPILYFSIGNQDLALAVAGEQVQGGVVVVDL